ncbi:MAG: hypothetical protein WA581_07665, partial [Candidatus Acidiferrales bacterium]
IKFVQYGCDFWKPATERVKLFSIDGPALASTVCDHRLRRRAAYVAIPEYVKQKHFRWPAHSQSEELEILHELRIISDSFPKLCELRLDLSGPLREASVFVCSQASQFSIKETLAFAPRLDGNFGLGD